MAVLVNQKDKKEENPLDRIAQLASIGVSAASIGSKAGGSPKTEADSGPILDADNKYDSPDIKKYENVAQNDNPLMRKFKSLKTFSVA